jgi:hypothetical protein
VGSGHPLLGAATQAAIERAASAHRGRRWVSQGFTSLDDRASHLCGILHGTPFSVFAKLSPAADAREQRTAELAGLRLLHQAARVAVPVPVASGLAETTAGVLLLYKALPERSPEAREPRDWRSIGQVLATVHQTRHDRFGLDGPRSFFGALPQDNRPVPANRWADFYRERRLEPMLRTAVDSGYLPPALAGGVEEVAERLRLRGTARAVAAARLPRRHRCRRGRPLRPPLPRPPRRRSPLLPLTAPVGQAAYVDRDDRPAAGCPPDAVEPGFHCVALDPGFHGVPAGPAHPDRAADGAGVT